MNTDYPLFLDQFYGRTPSLRRAPYATQMEERNRTFFGVGDAYSKALHEHGHFAVDVHVNNGHLQRAWAREHGLRWRPGRDEMHVRMRRGVVPWPSRGPSRRRLLEVLAAQIADARPDVILNHDISWIEPGLLREIAGPKPRLVGQHAAPPFPPADYGPYDLILSSWPPTIDRMRSAGVRAEHLGLGFDPRVLDHVADLERDLPVTFVGGLGSVHGDRVRFLEELCSAHPEILVFGPSMEELPDRSSIRKCYAGSAFGIDMFRILARSRVTLNHHGFREAHANNMRLFEATGVGTTLLTDAKPDLDRYFTPGREVLTYRSPSECLEIIRSDDFDTGLAERAQKRTLTEHTWKRRVISLLEIIDR